MTTEENQIMQYIEEEDVKFIRLAFCDIFGAQKNISVQPTELQRAFEKGYPIDASYVSGFGGDYGVDVWLHPEADTVSILPWRPEHGKVIRMFCSLCYSDGRPIEADTRSLLRGAVEYARQKGYRFHFKSEMQFYLFKTDDNGNRTYTPYDHAGYMDIAPLDKGENIRREVCLTLEFISVVRTIAARNGLYADFSPKPISDKPGSALHIRMSVKAKNGEEVTDRAIAGILKNIADMTIFLNPTEKSFKRFNKMKAPKFITWSDKNRAQLIFATRTESGGRCLQLRSPDPNANPYLAFALMIYAAVDGIENNYPLPPSIDTELQYLSSSGQNEIELLPDTIVRAQNAALNSDFIKRFIPDSIIKAYCN